MTPRAAITWRYLPRRSVKHALRTSRDYTGHDDTALCGTAPGLFVPADEWRGTGNQTEYDEVERLPECRRCAKLLQPRRKDGQPVSSLQDELTRILNQHNATNAPDFILAAYILDCLAAFNATIHRRCSPRSGRIDVPGKGSVPYPAEGTDNP